ncbi:MAG: Hpt domain-containing protein [Verrucomicrobiota bacterium]
MSELPVIENVFYDTTLPVMDRDQIDMLLMADSGDDGSALAAELFELYESESLEKLSELEEVCRDRDAAALRKLVHFIAGSAGNLGLARMSAFYRGIEIAIDGGLLEDFEACAKLIPQEFKLSCKLFREEFGLSED